jgi:putative SOS response-associated peptidase YedK
MPAILSRENEDRWLSKNAMSAMDLKEILTPFPAENLSMFPVSQLANTPDTDDERVIQPMDSSDYQLTL